MNKSLLQLTREVVLSGSEVLKTMLVMALFATPFVLLLIYGNQEPQPKYRICEVNGDCYRADSYEFVAPDGRAFPPECVRFQVVNNVHDRKSGPYKQLCTPHIIEVLDHE